MILPLSLTHTLSQTHTAESQVSREEIHYTEARVQSRGRSEESRGKNVQSVHDGTTAQLPQQAGRVGKG